jgi:hypothetical protein
VLRARRSATSYANYSTRPPTGTTLCCRTAGREPANNGTSRHSKVGASRLGRAREPTPQRPSRRVANRPSRHVGPERLRQTGRLAAPLADNPKEVTLPVSGGIEKNC